MERVNDGYAFSVNCLNFDLFVVNYETLSSC